MAGDMQVARRAAEHLADELRARAGVPAEGPIDVYRVANACSAVVVLDPDLRFDAQLLPQGERAVIRVQARHPEARQRFSVAHEVAHWAVMAPQLQTPAARRVNSAFTSEEVMANLVAGAILMPSMWMRARFGHAGDHRYHRLATVAAVASGAGVSLEAAMVRLRWMFRWDMTLVHWTRGGQRWVLDREAGVLPWEHGRVDAAAEAEDVLAWAAATRPECCELPLIIDGIERMLTVETSVRSDGILALVPLSKPSSRRKVFASSAA
jgi:Zn-dependent peptidase ImmA (M78 family)